MKAFVLEMMTLAVSLPVVGAVSSCLDSASDDYKCVFIGSGFSGNRLNLDSCGITDTDVDSGSLQDCFDKFGPSNIESLFFSDNDLTTLPVGVFDGLESLSILGLHSNGLTTLPDGVFNGLESLSFLNLSDNQLECLPTIPTVVNALFVDGSIEGVYCESDTEPCAEFGGILHEAPDGDTCCSEACGVCEGQDCRSRGRGKCCPWLLRRRGKECSATNPAPCKLAG